MAIALYKLASGSDYRTIGHFFAVGITTVCRCVQEFCTAAETLLVPEHIRNPSEEKFREMPVYFDNKYGLPNCVGSIDGPHIPIIAPQEYHCDYFNRKGWHSLLLQAVVDGKGRFWNLHDATVLGLSALWDLAIQRSLFPAHTRNIGGVSAGYYILGDFAYPLQNWLLKPFHDTGRLAAEQRMFNYKFSRARVVVENAFGRLKGRWRCLLKRNDSDIKLVTSMVYACSDLHNSENHGETYDTGLDVHEPATTPVAGAEGHGDGEGAEEEGRDVREGLMRHLLLNN